MNRSGVLVIPGLSCVGIHEIGLGKVRTLAFLDRSNSSQSKKTFRFPLVSED